MGKSFQRVVIIFVVLSTAYQLEARTPIRKCENEKPLPLMVQIDDCETLPCDFTKGIESNIVIQFVATKDSTLSLHADVRLTTLGVQIPFVLDTHRSEVCSNLLFGAYCPLDNGEDVTYRLVMQINKQQPEVPITLEVNLLDDSDNSIVACFVTNGRVKGRH